MHSLETMICVPVILIVILIGICLTVRTYSVCDRQTALYEKQNEDEDISKTEILRIAEAVSETFS